MEFLSVAEVRARENEVLAALATLFATPAVVPRPGARQWRFLAACVERLLSPAIASEFDRLTRVQAAQLKFEVQDRLRRHYLREQAHTGLVLTLVHRTEMAEYRIREGPPCPAIAGYSVLVRDLALDLTLHSEAEGEAVYLERVIAEAMDAEFRLYMAVPGFDISTLTPWFCADGPALRAIVDRARRRREQGWILSNSLNPSTKRLLSVKVREVGESEAVVGSTEYWYLRWWSSRTSEYIYAYRDTGRQGYILRRESDSWRIFENVKPSPRTVAPNRRVSRSR